MSFVLKDFSWGQRPDGSLRLLVCPFTFSTQIPNKLKTRKFAITLFSGAAGKLHKNDLHAKPALPTQFKIFLTSPLIRQRRQPAHIFFLVCRQAAHGTYAFTTTVSRRCSFVYLDRGKACQKTKKHKFVNKNQTGGICELLCASKTDIAQSASYFSVSVVVVF